MKTWSLIMGLVLLAGCTFPGFDYDTEPEYPDEIVTSLSVWTVPETIEIGEQLVVYGAYQSSEVMVEGASCRSIWEGIKSGMTYSSEGYVGTIDAGGLGNGTYSVGVECSKPGYEAKQGAASFSIE